MPRVEGMSDLELPRRESLPRFLARATLGLAAVSALVGWLLVSWVLWASSFDESYGDPNSWEMNGQVVLTLVGAIMGFIAVGTASLNTGGYSLDVRHGGRLCLRVVLPDVLLGQRRLGALATAAARLRS